MKPETEATIKRLTDLALTDECFLTEHDLISTVIELEQMHIYGDFGDMEEASHKARETLSSDFEFFLRERTSRERAGEDEHFIPVRRALALALASLEVMPQALLFLPWDEDRSCDIPETVFDLPVYYHGKLTNSTDDMKSGEVPWAPMWRKNIHASREYLDYFNETYLKELYE